MSASNAPTAASRCECEWGDRDPLTCQAAGRCLSDSAATKHIEPIQTILDALMGREPTEAEWENVPALAALRAIEQTLEADGAR